jgi:anti-anti-sigma factor
MVATLDGEVDSSNAGELRMALSERLPATASALVLDLSAVTYLDSSGIHLLFDLASRLGARRQQLRIVVPERAPTRRVLELCDIAAVAPPSATVSAAIEDASAERPG